REPHARRAGLSAPIPLPPRRREPAIAPRRASPDRSRSGGCRKVAPSLGTIAIFAVLLAAGGGWFLWRAVTSPYKGYSEPAKLVEVRKGLRTSTIVRHLQQKGIVRDQYIP